MIAAESEPNFWVEMNKAHWKVDGKEYLAFTKVRPPSPVANDKEILAEAFQKAMNKQRSLFIKRFNAINHTSLQGKQISKLLNDWQSNGTYGSSITDAINSIAQFQDGKAFSYSTGAVNLSGDFSNLSLAGAVNKFNQVKNKLLNFATEVKTTIDTEINKVVTTLAGQQEYMLAQAILNAYYTDTPIPANLQNLIPANTTVSDKVLSDSNAKMVETVSTLNTAIGNLAALGNGQTVSDKSIDDSFKSIVGSIAASFNSLGGMVHEATVALATANALIEGQQLIDRSNQIVGGMVKSSNGGSAQIQLTGETRFDLGDRDKQGNINGQDGKPDIMITYNQNGLELKLGGNIKFRQGKEFLGTSGRNSRAKKVSGFTAVNHTYKTIMPRVEPYMRGATEWGYAQAAAIPEGGSAPDYQSWSAIRNMMGVVTFVDSIAGTGVNSIDNTIQDFSSLLIVNNQVFSIYDIIERSLDQIAKMAIYGSHKPFTVEGMDLDSIHRQTFVDKEIENTFERAKERNRRARSILAQTKVTIGLNLGQLYSPDIFK